MQRLSFDGRVFSYETAIRVLDSLRKDESDTREYMLEESGNNAEYCRILVYGASSQFLGRY